MHPVLFLESKHSKKHAVWTLYVKTREIARKERRVPVIGLQEHSKPGILIVVHSDDIPRVYDEYMKARSPQKKRPQKKWSPPKPVRLAS
jgi:hypothetical protein